MEGGCGASLQADADADADADAVVEVEPEVAWAAGLGSGRVALLLLAKAMPDCGSTRLAGPPAEDDALCLEAGAAARWADAGGERSGISSSAGPGAGAVAGADA